MKNIIAIFSTILFSLSGTKAASTLTFIGQGWVFQNQKNFISTENDYQTSWNVQFGAPTGQVLTPGTYFATKYSPGHAQSFINLYGDGMAWSEINGLFKVLEIKWVANNVDSKLTVDFEIFEKPLPWTEGSVRMNSIVSISTIPEPGTPLMSSFILFLFLRRKRPAKKK
jgi:hypothetical protein